jgi:hypothetical protein
VQEWINSNGLTQVLVPIPHPSAQPGSQNKTRIELDTPKHAQMGLPFYVVIRIDRSPSETDSALRATQRSADRRYATIVSDIPLPLGLAELDAADANAALVDASSQEFFVADGMKSERIWTVTPNKAGPTHLRVLFGNYDTATPSIQGSDVDVEVTAPPAKPEQNKSYGAILLAAIVGLVVGYLVRRRSERGGSQRQRVRSAGVGDD